MRYGLGCTIGCIVALVAVEFFAQERWHLMLVFMPYIFGLTVMMLISPYAYAYKKTILVSLIIVTGAYDDWNQTFSIAVERTSETIMGVLVYMLVSALLWPRTNRKCRAIGGWVRLRRPRGNVLDTARP